MTNYVLHNYFRSSTSIRVRIALNLKGLDYHYVPIHLVKGEQQAAAFLELNPQGLVPTLVVNDALALSQSMAIIEYLEEAHPQPSLMPSEPLARAQVRGLAQIIGCDTHPLNNLRVLKYLKQNFDAGKDDVDIWFRHWAALGCEAFEAQLKTVAFGEYCFGDSPTLADICLYAQALNNQRFDVDMSPYPTINAIVERLATVDAFRDAEPARQIDAS